jgi:hypothetical protein
MTLAFWVVYILQLCTNAHLHHFSALLTSMLNTLVQRGHIDHIILKFCKQGGHKIILSRMISKRKKKSHILK